MRVLRPVDLILMSCYPQGMHRFTCRIPEALFQQAQAEARRKGFSLNALLLLALEAYLSARSVSASENAASPHATASRKRRSRRKR